MGSSASGKRGAHLVDMTGDCRVDRYRMDVRFSACRRSSFRFSTQVGDRTNREASLVLSTTQPNKATTTNSSRHGNELHPRMQIIKGRSR